MKYLSVCSGICAATVAWKPLGWEPVAFIEIEPFPCSVLKHHYPDVLNFGDMTKFREWNIEPGSVDVVVGGTPCQSFSIAGLRGGLDDSRGNLALTYCQILDRFRPRWFIWENVPGVLSSNKGRDFGSILGAMAELGYSFSWRILDAQNFGVPQRRRRVFVVGYLGDWRRPAEVLFEPGCLPGDTAKGGKKESNVAALTATGVGTCGADDNQGQAGHLIASPITSRPYSDGVGETRLVFHTLGTRFNAGGDGTGRGTPIVATSTGDRGHCLNAGGMGRQDYETETMVVADCRNGSISDTCQTLQSHHSGSSLNTMPVVVVAFSGRDRGDDGRGYTREPNITGPITETLDTMKPPRVAGPTIGVRRLTVMECERLQGFPDNYTLVPHRGKPACDGPRYKAIGNSMAVPVMRWLGQQIERVSNGD